MSAAMRLRPNDLDEQSVFTFVPGNPRFAVRRRWLTRAGTRPRVFGTADHFEAHRTLDRAEEARA